MKFKLNEGWKHTLESTVLYEAIDGGNALAIKEEAIRQLESCKELITEDYAMCTLEELVESFSALSEDSKAEDIDDILEDLYDFYDDNDILIK